MKAKNILAGIFTIAVAVLAVFYQEIKDLFDYEEFLLQKNQSKVIHLRREDFKVVWEEGDHGSPLVMIDDYRPPPWRRKN